MIKYMIFFIMEIVLYYIGVKRNMTEKIFAGKTGNASSEWLPLYMHLKDTAGIMEYLFERFLSDSFSNSCNLEIEELKNTAVFLAYVHDIGKATVAFQKKISNNIPELQGKLEHYGLELPDSMDISKIRKTPHALAGEVILRYFGCPDSVAVIVGSHHGEPTECYNVEDQNLENPPCDIVGYENYFGYNDKNREILETAWKKIIDDALERAGFDSVEDLPELDCHAQFLLTGLLIMADWISSNTTKFFPVIDIGKNETDIPYSERIENAWKETGFPDKWKSGKDKYNDDDFKSDFEFAPNAIQKELLDIIRNSEETGLFILEAPMGCGKTEAALSAAELLAARQKKSGLFFGLPTQATANGIFSRIKNWAEKRSCDGLHSIQLKHGSAELNKVFHDIWKGIPDAENDSGLIVHSWFCENKKGCLDNFVVATVDQMLMASLKRRHVMLLHLGLSEKVVIIDEVHAYDTYMNQYLERTLQWLGKYKTPVILLSATLPAKRRMSLVRAYLGTRKSDEKFEQNTAYPLLTWTHGKDIAQKQLTYEKPDKSVNTEVVNESDIFARIKEVTESGGCVGIIVNTVRRAQKIKSEISASITDNILLCHAQFILPDRMKKEEELLKRIGKNSTSDDRKGFVVVGTQVLEQSLDIDFDLLITDICPMDLLLQRMGRLQRHERKDRPESARNAVCLVMRDEIDNDKSGSISIYGEWLLKETLSELPETINMPADISPLVQKVYNACDESDAYNEYVSAQKISASKAKAFLLGKPNSSWDNTIHDMLEKSIQVKDDVKAEASVRDGISSVEVIALMKKDNDEICFMSGDSICMDLTNNECEKIAEQKLRLPSVFCQKWNIDRTISEIEEKSIPYIKGWQNLHLLKGKLILFFDEHSETELIDYHLKYSSDNGLIYEKGSEKCE